MTVYKPPWYRKPSSRAAGSKPAKCEFTLTPSDIVSFATKIEAITSSLKALPAMRHQSSMKGASSDDLNAPPLTVGLTSSTKWPYPIGPWLLRRTPKATYMPAGHWPTWHRTIVVHF